MNICHIVYSVYESDHRVRRYAEALAERGHKVDVIGLGAANQGRRGVLNGVNIERVQQRGYETGMWSYIIGNLSFFARVAVLVAKKYFIRCYDVFHIHNAPDFLVFAALIPKILGAKIILDMHENMPELYCSKFKKGPNSFGTRILLFVEKVSVKMADEVITAHDFLRTRIMLRDGVLGSNCTALLNYPDLRYYKTIKERLESDVFRVIYPGTLSYHHGLDIAIEAMGVVKKEYPNTKLKIYGKARDHLYLQTLQALIFKLGLEDNVEILDPVGFEHVAQIISKADVGVVPKRNDLFASEAFSGKIFDFMTVGLPVIASRTKIDEYYFDDSMIMFFEPENPQDLARCIIELMNSRGRRDSLVANGRRFIAENNWGKKVDIYLQIVERLSG
jgi:glycosyltransferase involved in cell wall biosynthesis